MSVRYITADVLDGLACLADHSVDLVMTSPPFLAIRSYLPDDHPDKDREIGREGSPAQFVDALLDVVGALDRVLAPHGSICIELGDTYSGSGGAGGDYNSGGLRDGQPKARGSSAGIGYPRPKSLSMVPESFRWALAYGRNPFNGRPCHRWIVRNVVRWHRPNPPIGMLFDKFRPATSDMVVACKRSDRYWDPLGARQEAKSDRPRRARPTDKYGDDRRIQGSRGLAASDFIPNGTLPVLDTWIIPTGRYQGAHYATYPEALCVVPIQSMCPEEVCRVCGEPRRRVIVDGEEPTWTDCGHGNYRPGMVLDPFAGSGTTLAVAVGHGRDAIGIDIDERNCELAKQRIGMWLE